MKVRPLDVILIVLIVALTCIIFIRTEAQGAEFYHDDAGSKPAECLYSEEDLRLMSAIIWCEAGNQCMAGKEAVGIVVMNRMENDTWWSDTVEGVIFDEGQFSPAMDGWIYDALWMYDNGELPQDCIIAAMYALNGHKEVKYGAYIYDMSDYYFFGLYRDDCRLVIGDHEFA